MADETPTDVAPAPEERVFVTDKYGRRFSLPASQAATAVSQGYSPEAEDDKKERLLQEKYGDTAGEIKATAAGAARGVTFGLSDLALTKSGLVNPETLQGLKDANPGLSTASEIAGAGIGLLAGPGALVAKGAGLAAKGAAAVVGEGLAARAIGGAVEGGIYGLGNTVTEASLGDTELNAQKLAAGAGIGALLGGAGAAAGDLIGTAAKKAAQPISDALAAAPAQIQEMAENRALKATGFIQSDLSKLPEEQQRRIARRLLDQDLLKPGQKSGDILEAIRGSSAASKKEAAGILAKADEVSPVAEAPFAGKGESGDIAATQGGFDVKGAISRIEKELVEPNQQNPLRLKAINDTLDQIRGLGGEEGRTSFVNANQFKNDMQEGLFGALDPKLKMKLSRQVEGIFNDELKTQVGTTLGVEHETALRAAQLNTADLIKAEKAAQKGVNREVGNRAISGTDYVAGAIGSTIGGPIGAVAGALTNKIARERLPSALAWGMDRLAKSPVFDSLAQGFSTFAQKQMSAAPGLLGDLGPVLSNALARSPAEGLLTHASLSARTDSVGQQYRDAMTQAGLDYSEDGAAKHAQAVQLAALQYQLKRHDSAMDDAIKGAITGGAVAPSSAMRSPLLGDMKTGPLKTWDERTQALQKLVDHPELLTERIAEGLGPLQGMAPQLAAALSTTLSTGVNFLASKVPKPADNPLGQIKALKVLFTPSDAQRKQFERYVSAVQDPGSVFEGLKQGAVTREAVEAMKAVYPSLLNDIQQRTLNVLATHPDAIPLAQKTALTQLLGVPLAPALQQKKLAQLQGNFGAPSSGPPGAGGAPPGNHPMKPGKPAYTRTEQQMDSTFTT